MGDKLADWSTFRTIWSWTYALNPCFSILRMYVPIGSRENRKAPVVLVPYVLSESRLHVQNIHVGVGYPRAARIEHRAAKARGRELCPGILRRQENCKRQNPEDCTLVRSQFAASDAQHFSLLLINVNRVTEGLASTRTCGSSIVFFYYPYWRGSYVDLAGCQGACPMVCPMVPLSGALRRLQRNAHATEMIRPFAGDLNPLAMHKFSDLYNVVGNAHDDEQVCRRARFAEAARRCSREEYG